MHDISVDDHGAPLTQTAELVTEAGRGCGQDLGDGRSTELDPPGAGDLAGLRPLAAYEQLVAPHL